MNYAREHHAFTDYKTWDADLNTAIKKFRSRYGTCPNILLANDDTLEKISEAANQQGSDNFYGSEGDTIKQKPMEEYSGVSNFITANCLVEFCLDDQIPNSCFALIFDAEADISDPLPPQ